MNLKNAMPTAPVLIRGALEPDHNVPIGTPPAGGRWTWDAGHQAWVPLPDIPAAPAAPATETAAASKE